MGRDETQKKEQSPGLLPPEETLIDVGLEETRVAVARHQAVDELLRRVEGGQRRLTNVLGDVFPRAAVYVNLGIRSRRRRS